MYQQPVSNFVTVQHTFNYVSKRMSQYMCTFLYFWFCLLFLFLFDIFLSFPKLIFQLSVFDLNLIQIIINYKRCSTSSTEY